MTNIFLSPAALLKATPGVSWDSWDNINDLLICVGDTEEPQSSSRGLSGNSSNYKLGTLTLPSCYFSWIYNIEPQIIIVPIIYSNNTYINLSGITSTAIMNLIDYGKSIYVYYYDVNDGYTEIVSTSEINGNQNSLFIGTISYGDLYINDSGIITISIAAPS